MACQLAVAEPGPLIVTLAESSREPVSPTNDVSFRAAGLAASVSGALTMSVSITRAGEPVAPPTVTVKVST